MSSKPTDSLKSSRSRLSISSLFRRRHGRPFRWRKSKLNDGFYHSHPIPNQTRMIRLLLIQPGEFFDPIQCKVRNANLDEEDLKYDTLSYPWGERGSQTTISVDDFTVDVTTNLRDALKYTRHKTEVITIWVDAICIDQSNNAEKTHQVGMMRDIYKDCSRVYIWLGCDEEHSTSDVADIGSNPFTFFYHGSEDKHVYELPNFERVDEEYQYRRSLDSTYGYEEARSDLWSGLDKIAHSTWWCRVWTLQEVVLPPEAIVLYGPWRTHWETLTTWRNNFKAHRWKCCLKAFNTVPHDMFTDALNLLDQIFYIDNVKGLPSGSFFSFHSTAMAHRPRMSFDPRDRLFGFLGLADPRVYHDVSANYTMDIANIYEQIFRTMLSEASLDCFLGSWFTPEIFSPRYDGEDSSSVPGLPSWVPNFSISLDQRASENELERLNRYNCYSAAGSTRTNYRFDDDSTLYMTGQRVATVQKVGTAPIYWDNIRDLYQQCIDAVEDSVGSFLIEKDRKSIARKVLGELTRSYYSNDTMRATIMWTKTTAEEDEMFGKWLEGDFINQNNDFEGDIESLVSASLYTTIVSRVFFVTTDGTLGFSPPNTEPGDEIWIFHGGNMPFMVRPQSVGNEKTYNFIGDTYLEGIMFGKWFESRGFKEEDGVEIALK
ncbi:Heterokaryon incompatibility protein 6 OR allele [Lachnellula suecica]|uniref:Heterokaryon incompatibility protein 6 OR allele n=1 Tax=Lachnellula suecica TaxID=602035 RepID=A0A8T9CH17_9HELO|nr:Heterokaryon incompatibility protein 6 OR allele [Lachnellula suecica]